MSENSNVLQWLDYVGCNGVRSFVGAPVDSWRDKMGSTFGKSITGGWDVTTQNEYLAAVRMMRDQGKKGDFIDWLLSGQSPRGTDWARYLARDGNINFKDYFFGKLQERGLHVIGLWDFRCLALRMETFLDNKPEYWGERYEETLLFYIGGYMASKWGIDDVEVYNEPDLDWKKYGCIDTDRFRDLLRIRSQAVRAAYEDRNSYVRIHVGSFTQGWNSVLSKIVAENQRTPFPDPDFWQQFKNTKQADDDEETYEAPQDLIEDMIGGPKLGEYYALHDYGSFSAASCTEYGPSCRHENGYGVAKNANKAISRLKQYNVRDLDVSITEFNCYTAAQSDKAGHAYFEGQNVVDNGATAACLASQFSGFNKQGANKNYKFVNVHKFMQTKHSDMPSGLAKNGLLFGNFHEDRGLDEAVKMLGGISRTGMALRQVCTKGGFGNAVYGFSSYDGKNVNSKLNRFNIWTVKDGDVAHIFAMNDNWVSTNAQINVQKFNAEPNQPYWVTEISDGAFAEVTQRSDTGENKDFYLDIPHSSFKVVTVPMVPSHWEIIESSKDGEIGKTYYGPGDRKTMRVHTDGDDTSVIMVKFDKGDRNVVGANLELTLEHSTNDQPQVLTVVGWNSDWDEGYQPWSRTPFLRQNFGDTSVISGNVLNWDQVDIIGYITVPPNAYSGQKVSLDVSDWIDRVSNFAIMRLVRHDASPKPGPSQTPRDELRGEYFFHTREADNPDDRPKLFLAVRN